MKALSFSNATQLFPSTNQGSRIKMKEYHIFVILLLSLQLTCQRLSRWNENRVSNHQAKRTKSLKRVPVPQALWDPHTETQTQDHAILNSSPAALHSSWEQVLSREQQLHFIVLHKSLFQGNQQESKTEHKQNMHCRGLSYHSWEKESPSQHLPIQKIRNPGKVFLHC